jgi:hypothetical protein
MRGNQIGWVHMGNRFYNAETKDIQVFDFREFAPGAASQNMYQANPNESQYGGKAIAVVSRKPEYGGETLNILWKYSCFKYE